MNDVLLVCFRVVMRCAAWGAARALGEQRRRLVRARVARSLQSLRRRHQVGLFTRAMWPRRGLRGAACSGVIQLAGPRHPPRSPALQLTARLLQALVATTASPSMKPRDDYLNGDGECTGRAVRSGVCVRGKRRVANCAAAPCRRSASSPLAAPTIFFVVNTAISFYSLKSLQYSKWCK